jgi:hypothetical protein
MRTPCGDALSAAATRRYFVSYAPVLSGSHRLHVHLVARDGRKEQPVLGSPFALVVKPGAICARYRPL